MNEETGTTRKPGRGRETLFRIAVRHQIDLIQIADYKANMIITINALVISSIIAAIGYGVVSGNLSNYGLSLLLPISMVLLFCLSSLVMAILAARPKLIVQSSGEPDAHQNSIFFFGEISRHTQADYVKKVREMLTTEHDIYDHLTIEMYNQGLVLKRKYAQLVLAYQILMFGFILSVLMFLIFMLVQL